MCRWWSPSADGMTTHRPHPDYRFEHWERRARWITLTSGGNNGADHNHRIPRVLISEGPATAREQQGICLILRSWCGRTRLTKTALLTMFRALAVLKRYLLIFSDRIFDSNVDRLIPSFLLPRTVPDNPPFASCTGSLNHLFLVGSKLVR